MVDETNVDDFLESILGRSLKSLAKSRIKRIAKTGFRKDPLRYPAGWKGEPGEVPGTFARKEDLPAVRGRQNKNPARSKGGARGSKAAAMQKDQETRSAISRAGRSGKNEQSTSKARRALSDAAKAEAKSRTDRPGSTALQKSGKETPESRAAEKAGRQAASRVRGFRRVQGFLNRKLKVGDDAEARRLVDTAISNALDGKQSESDSNKIEAAFANVRKIVMKQIADMDGLDGAGKRDLQAEAKRMITEAREALQKDLAERSSLSKSGKGAQGRAPVKKTPSGRTRTTSDATGASAGLPRTNVGDEKPVVPPGKPKRKRIGIPVPVGKKGNTFGPNVPGSVEDKDGNLQAPVMPRRKKGKSKLPASKKGGMIPSVAEKIKDIERRDKTRGRLFDDDMSDSESLYAKKRADAAAKRKKKMKESLVIDVVSRFANTEDV
jgi:hypothetical protein